jgi:hypothetical protein
MSEVTLMKADPRVQSGLVLPVFPQNAKFHEPVEGTTEQGLEVSVVFTDREGSLAALGLAEGLARDLGARIRLLMPFQVPYTLPLTRPQVPVDFLRHQILDVAGKCQVEIAAEIWLCRDKRQALLFLLRPNTLIVVGGSKRWWPTAAQLLARAIQREGHQVVFAELR